MALAAVRSDRGAAAAAAAAAAGAAAGAAAAAAQGRRRRRRVRIHAAASAAFAPRALDAASRAALLEHLDALAPPRGGATPLAPVVGALLPVVSAPVLGAAPPGALLAALRLVHWAGAEPGRAWLDAWAAAVRGARLGGDVAARLLAEALRVRQPLLPAGLLDALLDAVHQDVAGCASESLAAALAAVAAADLRAGSDTGGDGLGALAAARAATAAAAAGSALSSGGGGGGRGAAAVAAAAAPPSADSFSGLVAGLPGGGGGGGDGSGGQRAASPVGPLSSREELADAAAAAEARQQGPAADAGAEPWSPWRSSGGRPGSPAPGAAASVNTAAWMAGRPAAGPPASPQLASSGTQLLPVVLAAAVAELGGPGRLAALSPTQLAAVAAAVAALQLPVPAGWLDHLVEALQAQLPRLPPPALASLANSLPLLMPVGGTLRLWRQLAALVTEQSAALSPAQLCEVLPLVESADLAVPVEWLQAVLARVEASMGSVTLTQASRALVSAVALGCAPPPPWTAAFLARLAGGVAELSSEGLVGVLRALSAAGTLPSHDWLTALEDSTGRRFGFIGPVELSATAFLFSNVGHAPSSAWRAGWAREAAKFSAYLTGPALCQVVWSAVRLGVEPDEVWLVAFVDQMKQQVSHLAPYELAFTLAALQKLGAGLGARLDPELVDGAVGAFAAALRSTPAAPSDTALLLVTLARAGAVPSIEPVEVILDAAQARMLSYDGQALVTLLWSLATLHHQPSPEFLAIFAEAAEAELPGLTGAQLSELMWACAQLRWTPPPAFLDALLARCQARLAVAEFTGRDAASLLASLAKLEHTPPEPFLHALLNLVHWRLPTLDPESMASVAVSLSRLRVAIAPGPWLDAFVSMTTSRLSGMAADSLVGLVTALAGWTTPPRAWVGAFSLVCIQQAEAGEMGAEQLEQVLVALGCRGCALSGALCQLYFDGSRGALERGDDVPPARVAGVLRALQAADAQPDVEWLRAAVGAVRRDLEQYSRDELAAVSSALGTFEAAGLRAAFLSDFAAFLREFF
ncbi:TBC2 [Scenedesmus sp. PABB004]|nr:TBC2 [Scenedesmus sp. PABB004]